MQGNLSYLLLAWTLVVGGIASVTAGNPSGGFGCVGCVLVVHTAGEYAELHETGIDAALQQLCSYLPSTYRTPCDDFVAVFGPAIVSLFAQGWTPDQICSDDGLHLCHASQCVLFPSSSARAASQGANSWDRPEEAEAQQGFQTLMGRLFGGRPWNDDFNDWLPLTDDDGDYFSTEPTFRGYNWRGADCDDHNAEFYPGRRAVDANVAQRGEDYNCNGIHGLNAQGEPYKTQLCGSTPSQGLIITGASAEAHFHIPPQWLDASAINATTYADLAYASSDELDWPERSWATGFPVPGDPMNAWVNSMAMRMRERNRCTHRDFQMIAHNGFGSDKIVPILRTMRRNGTQDEPALVIYATIGDDICHQTQTDILEAMTTPEEFRSNVLEALDLLENQLAPGSHVLFVGLVDARILWDALSNRTNPIGRSYADVYAWLECLGVNPCPQWLTRNETMRNAASARAAELSQQFVDIIATRSYNHFDMAYTPFPLKEIIEMWVARGGAVTDLIEPVDGFHPSTYGHYMLAEYVWNFLAQNHSNFLVPINPNNDLIQKLFGDQGGYTP